VLESVWSPYKPLSQCVSCGFAFCSCHFRSLAFLILG
jgi:hypothetical protein